MAKKSMYSRVTRKAKKAAKSVAKSAKKVAKKVSVGSVLAHACLGTGNGTCSE